MPRSSPQILDVRPMRTRRIPMVVRAAVNRLDAGGSFVLVADSDPTWICRTVAERTETTIRWTCLRNGPGAWHVRVEREGEGKDESRRRRGEERGKG